MPKQIKEKIIEIVEDLNIADEEWVKKYGDKVYCDVFLELFEQEKQKLIKEIEIALDKKHEKEPDENIRQGISYAINMLVKFR